MNLYKCVDKSAFGTDLPKQNKSERNKEKIYSPERTAKCGYLKRYEKSPQKSRETKK